MSENHYWKTHFEGNQMEICNFVRQTENAALKVHMSTILVISTENENLQLARQ